MKRYALGLDFGTESARAVLVDVETGEMVSTAVHAYTHGVMDEFLPGGGERLPPNWALQDPADWLESAQVIVHAVLKESNAPGKAVVGLGIDFTSCTILPVWQDGTPLCQLAGLAGLPHAWAKLWKHHGAQPQAEQVTRLATERGEPWLARYGGKISSEWLLPKALELLEEAPELYNKAAYIIEGADWVTWQLTGLQVRNTCCAGYKGTWHKQAGFPGKEYLRALNPELADLFSQKVNGELLAPGQKVGTLSAEWAERLGLTTDCAVSAAIIDAHAAAIGGGVSTAGCMCMIMGTSTCHMLMSAQEVLVEGISGVVEDGIVPGLFGYEAGQAGVGDIFAWVVENYVPARYEAEAHTRGISLHLLLSEKAAAFRAGQSGLLALDWWNGCRTPFVDADLSGLIVGYNLHTRPEEVYRALIEATAFGTRLIVELFREGGVAIDAFRAGGGLTKNDLVMQIYADVLGLPIEIAASPQASGLGAAILGAVAGGVYADIHSAVQHMVDPPVKKVIPDSGNHAIYNDVYVEYKRLVALFGRSVGSVMKNVLQIRNRHLSSSLD